MNQTNNSDGRFGELAHQSTVVIQCTHDLKDMVNRTRVKDNDVIRYPAAKPTLDKGVVRIDRGDLVFQCGTSKAPRASMLNNAIPALSNMNGAYINKNRNKNVGDDEKEQLQAISESIRFLGLALNGTSPNPENGEDQTTQFTVRTQGTGQVFNTGDHNIVPGQTLIWDLFTKEEVKSKEYKKRNTRFGFDENKVVLKVIPMDEGANIGYSDSILDAFSMNTKTEEDKLKNTAIGQFGLQMKEFIIRIIHFTLSKHSQRKGSKMNLNLQEFKSPKNSLLNQIIPSLITELANSGLGELDLLIKAFLNVQHDLDRRKIGKALSYAKSGEPIDVLLGTN